MHDPSYLCTAGRALAWHTAVAWLSSKWQLSGSGARAQGQAKQLLQHACRRTLCSPLPVHAPPSCCSQVRCTSRACALVDPADLQIGLLTAERLQAPAMAMLEVPVSLLQEQGLSKHCLELRKLELEACARVSELRAQLEQAFPEKQRLTQLSYRGHKLPAGQQSLLQPFVGPADGSLPRFSATFAPCFEVQLQDEAGTTFSVFPLATDTLAALRREAADVTGYAAQLYGSKWLTAAQPGVWSAGCPVTAFSSAARARSWLQAATLCSSSALGQAALSPLAGRRTSDC